MIPINEQMIMSKRSPLLFFFSTVAIIALMTLFGPQEESLGSNVRIVYLHGAWVLTAEAAFLLAGICGALALSSSWPPLIFCGVVVIICVPYSNPFQLNVQMI